MLSIAQYVWSHEGAPSQPSHLSVPGIWAKLNQLYDLPALDAREMQYATGIERKGGYESGDEDVLMREVHPADEYDAEAEGDEDQLVQKMVREFSLEEGFSRGDFHERMMLRRQRSKGDPGSDAGEDDEDAEQPEEEEEDEDVKAEGSEEDEDPEEPNDEDGEDDGPADEAEASEPATSPAPTIEKDPRKGSVARSGPRKTRTTRRTTTRRASASASVASPEGEDDDVDEGAEEEGDESQAGSKASSPPARTRRSLAKAGGGSAAATPTATTRAGSRQKSTRRAK